MECRSCGATVEANQAQCPACGAAVQHGFQPPAPPPPPGAEPTQAWPVQAAPPQAPPPAAGGYQPPGFQPPATGYEPTAAYQAPAYQPPAFDTAPAQPAAAAAGSPVAFAANPLTIAGLLAAVVGIVGCFLQLVELKIDGDVVYKAKLGDLSGNGVVVGIIAAVVLLAAVFIGAGSRSFATGLAGGAGVGLAGWATLHIAMAIWAMDDQEGAAIAGASGGEITVTRTFAIGFFFLAVAAALGLAVFVLSLGGAKDHGPRFAPLAALIGGIGALAMVVGPLIPQKGAKFGDNFSNASIPPATLWLRLLVLVVLLVAALIGFFNGRRWGLGLATGAVVVSLVQVVTTLSEAKTKPNVGVGITNFFAEKVHIVTVLGAAVWVVGLVLAAVALNQKKTTAASSPTAWPAP